MFFTIILITNPQQNAHFPLMHFVIRIFRGHSGKGYISGLISKKWLLVKIEDWWEIADVTILIPVSRKGLWLVQLALHSLPAPIKCGPKIQLYHFVQKWFLSSCMHMDEVLFSDKRIWGSTHLNRLVFLLLFFL